MNALIPLFWQVADVWAASIWRASLVACVAIVAAWAIARWCTFLSPRVVCWIWRLACLKLLLALVWIQPVDLALLPAKPGPLVASEPIASVATGWVDGAHSEGQLDGFTTEPSPTAETRRSGSVLPGLLLPLWLVGVVWCIARTAGQWRSVRRLRSASRICAADRLLQMRSEEGRRLGVRRLPELLFSPGIESPLLVGLWRPAIILPDRVEEKFDQSELRLMIAHELAHLKRHDLAWNWLPTVAGWLFFFHPLVWLMTRRWSEAQEAACDELVIQHGVAQPTDYGRLLIKLSACSAFESSAALGAAGVLGAYHNLERRILAMTRVKPFSARRLAVAAGVLLIAAAVTIVPWRLVAAEPKAEKGKPPVAADPNPEEEEPSPNAAFITGTFIVDRSREPKAAPDPATLAALKRLEELGAWATPAGVLSDTGVSIGKGWKGTEADLDLIAQLADLKVLSFGFDDVPAKAVAKLVPKLKQPVDGLQLEGLSDERLTALGRLPKCKSLMLGQQTLSAAGFRHLAEMADGIESFNAGSQIDDAALAGIGQIKSLKDLFLSGAKITDAGLAHLAGLERLEKLKLQDCRGIRGAGCASLSPLKSLREFDLSGRRIGADAIAALAKLTQLESLTLWTVSLPPAGLQAADVAALGNLKNLRKFQFTVVGQASDAAKQASGSAILAVIGQLPALTDLSVVGVPADADSLEALAKASSLEELRLFYVPVSERNFAALGQLKNLKRLRLACNGVVTAAASAKLNGLAQLTLLDLMNSSLDDAGLAAMANLPALEELDLTGSKITGTGLKALASPGQLKTLSLNSAPFTDEGAEALRGFPALESLNLGATNITDRALDAIATLPNLSFLGLDNTQVTADGLLKLRNLKKLSQLMATGVKLSDADLARLRAAMPDVQIFVPDFSDFTAANATGETAIVGATVLGNRGKLDEAFALLEKAHKEKPSPAVCRAAAEILRDNFDKATDAQKKLVEQWLAAAINEDAPDDVTLRLLLAELQVMEFEEGKLNEAMKVYRGLLAQADLGKEQRAVIQNNLAYILVTRGTEKDVAEARALIDAAVAQLGSVAGVLDTRGLIHLAQGDAKSAVADFKAAVAKIPTAINYFHLALAEEKARNAAGATEAFQKVEERKLDLNSLSPREQRDYRRLKEAMAKRDKP